MRNPPQHWQGRIRQAANEEAVLAVVQDYVHSLPRDGLAKLPASSRPDGVAARDEVIALNVQVARDELLFSGPTDVRELLREMVTVHTEASARLTSLAMGPPSGGF